MCSRFNFGGIARFACALISLVALFACAAPKTAQAEITTYGNVFHVDPSFSTLIESSGDRMMINAVAASSEGGFFVGGNFTAISGQQRLGLAKFKADGTVDSTFNLNGGFDGPVEWIAVQTDGRVLVSGNFSSFNGTVRVGFARLNADGTLDTTFSPGSGFAYAGRLVVQTDGRILVGTRGGTFSAIWVSHSSGGGAEAGKDVALADATISDLSKGIARLNTDGTVDTSFNPPGTGFDGPATSIAVQADGRILVGGYFTAFNGTPRANIARLNADGTLDTTFNPGSGFDSSVGSLAVQADGKILAVGSFATFNGTARVGVARLNTNGALDTSFNVAPELGFTPTELALQTDGKVVVGGYSTGYVAGNAPANTARLNTDGSRDFVYGPSLPNMLTVQALTLQTNGRIVVGGYFNSPNGSATASLARLSTTGVLETLSTGNSRCLGSVQDAVSVTGGKYIVGGTFNWINGTARNGIARINADGSLDTSFNIGSGFDYAVSCFVVQPDGKVVAGGYFASFNGTPCINFARLNTNGTLDTSFSSDSRQSYGQVLAMALQPNGRILAGGYFTLTTTGNMAGLIRMNADGAFDSTFRPNFNFDAANTNYAHSLALQTDGRILAAGDFAVGGTATGIARFNADGSLDSNFTHFFDANMWGDCVALQSDGAVLFGGLFSSVGGLTRNGIARLNTNGTLDTTFDPGVGFFDATSMTPQTDGRVVVGSKYVANGPARLNADGSRDNGFSVIGNNSIVTSIHYTEDGRLFLTGGIALGTGGVKQVGVVLLKSDETIVSSSSSSSSGSSSSSSSSSGGGGGAPSGWFVLAILALLVNGRRRLVGHGR